MNLLLFLMLAAEPVYEHSLCSKDSKMHFIFTVNDLKAFAKFSCRLLTPMNLNWRSLLCSSINFPPTFEERIVEISSCKRVPVSSFVLEETRNIPWLVVSRKHVWI